MARLVLVGFPLSPIGEVFCCYCAILAKGTLLAPQMEQIEAGLADDTRDEFRIGVDKVTVMKLVQLAVTMAPLPQLGGAVVPLCWLHLPAIDGNAPPPEQQQQQQQQRGLIVPPGNDKTKRRLS